MSAAKLLGMVCVWKDGEHWRYVPVGEWAPENAEVGSPQARSQLAGFLGPPYSGRCHRPGGRGLASPQYAAFQDGVVAAVRIESVS